MSSGKTFFKHFQVKFIIFTLLSGYLLNSAATTVTAEGMIVHFPSPVSQYSDSTGTAPFYIEGSDSINTSDSYAVISSSANLSTGELKAYAEGQLLSTNLTLPIVFSRSMFSEELIQLEYIGNPGDDWSFQFRTDLSFGPAGIVGDASLIQRIRLQADAWSTSGGGLVSVYDPIFWERSLTTSNYLSEPAASVFTINVPGEFDFAQLRLSLVQIETNAGFDSIDGATHNIVDVSATSTSYIVLTPNVIASSNSGVFPISAVPVPPATWLFGSGLIGIIGIARRKVNV